MHQKGILLHGGPPSNFHFAGEILEEKTFHWHMVQVKKLPRHTVVTKQKCVVYIYWNPIRYMVY